MAITDILSFKTRRRAGRSSRRAGIRRVLRGLGGALALALLSAGCDQPVPSTSSSPAAHGCDPNRERCTAATRWGVLNLELSPQPLPVLDPIVIEVRFDRANETRISAQLDGVDMEMGPNLTTLQRIDGQTLRGRLIIPICLTGTMQWRLRLLIKDGALEETADFHFAAPIQPGDAVADHRR